MHEAVLKDGRRQVYGAFGTWQGTNENTMRIEADWAGISPEERAAIEERERAYHAKNEEEKREKAQFAANRAAQQWAEASTEGTSPYAERKQIATPGLRFQADGTMLIPMLAVQGEARVLVGLQKITTDGTKRFNKGMSKQGSFCPIGKIAPDDRVIFMAEGYATGRTVRQATDDAVGGYVAFDAGSLIHVARMARQAHPEAHIVFCADDDFEIEPRVHKDLEKRFGVTGLQIDGQEYELEGKDGVYKCRATWTPGIAETYFVELAVRASGFSTVLKFENTGLVKAHQAAEEVGNASVTAPVFADRRENAWTDWNDLHCSEGIEVCRAQLGKAILYALTPPAVKTRMAERELESSVLPDNVVPITEKKSKKKKAKAADPAGAGQGEIPDGPPDGDNPENSELRWQSRLARTEKGQVLPVLSNVVSILKNAEEWQGVVAYEEFSGQVVKLKPPPYERGEVGEWSDMDDLRTALWLQQTYSFHPREDIVMKAVLLAADLHSHHVVRAYLDPLVWDKKERLSHWIVDCLGAEDTEYVRRVSRKFLIAAVARIYKPGIKMDNVLILEGSQGLYKSTALKVLAGEWFTDAPLRFGDKDTYAIMRGKWFIELAELDSFNKAESEAAKQFFGQYIDRFRNFYGKRASDVPRQQVFTGTTNKINGYLKDETGNRRYWPVAVFEIMLDLLREIRDQLWAEAVEAFKAGEAFWETPADVDIFREAQDARFIEDSYTELIANGLLGKSVTSVTGVLQDILKLDVAKWTMPEQQRVGRSMTRLGWIRKRDSGGKRDWKYHRPAPATPAPTSGEPQRPGQDNDAPF